MIVILKPNPDQEQLDALIRWIKGKGLDIDKSEGTSQTILGLIGDTSKIDTDLISALDIVSSVRRVQEPYKKANRNFHPADTVVHVGNACIGGGGFAVLAGPACVESKEQMEGIAALVKECDAAVLGGDGFVTRNSPYAYRGLQEEGISLLVEAGKTAGLPVISEIGHISQLEAFKDVDMFAVGARNMQNYELLRALGQTGKPILLRRGRSATAEELLMSAEYILNEGNPNVVLCESGIRSFNTYTKYTLDLSILPELKLHTHLPVIADPAEACGHYELVPALAAAAAAAGADGILLDVHTDPMNAKSAAGQHLKPETFKKTVAKCKAVHECMKKEA